MWPYYNHAVGQQVLEQVNPIIAEQLKPVRAPQAFFVHQLLATSSLSSWEWVCLLD